MCSAGTWFVSIKPKKVVKDLKNRDETKLTKLITVVTTKQRQ